VGGAYSQGVALGCHIFSLLGWCWIANFQLSGWDWIDNFQRFRLVLDCKTFSVSGWCWISNNRLSQLFQTIVYRNY
jgi:hypothetical protein